MAKLIDAEPESTSQSLDEVTAALTPQEAPEANQADAEPAGDPSLDGKSPEELKAMLVEQKQMIGRQSNDVGSARKEAEKLRAELEAIRRTDALMQGQLAAQSKEPEPKPDYFGDPESAIKTQISSDPDIQRMRDELETLRVDSIKRDLSSAHPDYREVLSSGEFEQWVSESPIRRQSYAAMNSNYDIDIAKELIAGFKATKAEPQAQKPARADRVRAASSGNVTGSSEPGAGKKVRAVDLRDLKIRNPARYEELMPEIIQAYREGRVID